MHFPCNEVYHRMGIEWEKSTHTMGKVWLPISQVFPIRWVLLHFPVLWEIDGKTHAFPIWWSTPRDGNRMGKKYPYYGKSMIIDFPGFPHTIGFVAFSRIVENWWENPCISHMMKYTKRWESDGEKVPILGEKFDYQFPKFSPYDGFCCIFLYYRKLMGKPMHFPYNQVHHRMGTGWGKKVPTLWEKYDYQFPGFFPYDGFCCIFPCYGKLMGKLCHFPYHEIR